MFPKSKIHDHTFQNGVLGSFASINVFVHHQSKLSRICSYCETSQRVYPVNGYCDIVSVAHGIRHLAWGPFDLKSLADHLQNSCHSDTVGEMLTCGRWAQIFLALPSRTGAISLPLESEVASDLPGVTDAAQVGCEFQSPDLQKSCRLTFALLGLRPETST